MFRPFRSLASFEDARRALDDVLSSPPRREEVALDEAHGRVLAEDLAAPQDVPGFDRSAMDGYAVRSSDVADASRDSPIALAVVADAHAGDPRRRIRAGEAVQIATGAVLPDGADAVVMAEDSAREGARVLVRFAVPPGAHVSARGGDFRRGDVLLRRGRRLDAAALGLAASLGFAALPTFQPPKIAIVPSGSEVVEPGLPLVEGQVYDSNSRALAGLVLRLGGVPLRRPATVDTAEAHRRALDEAAATADLVVVTGGTSVGERDLLAPLVAERGEVRIHGLRLRPGKPVLVGRWGRTPLLGLPGYPASTLVTSEVLLSPAVRKLSGDASPPRLPAACIWGHDVAVRADLTTVVPVRVERGVATSVYKESGTMTSVVGSDGYAIFPEGSGGAKKGGRAEVHAWSWT